MATALPSGLVADQVILSAMRERPGLSRANGSPLPTNLSARAIRDFMTEGRIGVAALPALLTGLRDPEALDEAFHAAAKGAGRWAVHMNPVSLQLSDLLPPRDFRALSKGEALVVQRDMAPSALLHLDVLSQVDGRVRDLFATDLPPGMVSSLEDHWAWGRLPCSHMLLTASTRQTWERKAAHEQRLHADPVTRSEVLDDHWMGLEVEPLRLEQALLAQDDVDFGPEVAAYLDAVAEEAIESLSPDTPRVVGTGGVSYENPWLPAVLTSPGRGWQLVLRDDEKVVAGRFLGQELYKVTGEDAGLWLVACELLQGWDRSLPEWLDAVAALA